MCGIAGIVSKQIAELDLAQSIVRMSEAISHRGPDGSGFLAIGANEETPCYYQHSNYERVDLSYIPKIKITEFAQNFSGVFAHRRLAILDLSDTGHQPMNYDANNTWITYNGELYNYIELRQELKSYGHTFISESDTEVILAAYAQWGFDCVSRFNGMWAFCIYDSGKNIYFASRDRLGVKPFYYVNEPQLFAFASEQKAFIKAGLIKPMINEKALHNYLINGRLEAEPANFFEGVLELWPGSNLVYDATAKTIEIRDYFHLSRIVNLSYDALDENSLINKINHCLENAVRLRLRSDVEVGTCLSGGIDSSVLAVLISQITRQPLYCFTSVFSGKSFNEEHYADIVAKQVNAKHVKTEPTLEGFLKEVDDLVYSQDVPIWSTSTYAQYKVMELAKKNNIKVVLDGQGADELFGGYHHHFVARWRALISAGNYLSALSHMKASGKTIPGAYFFYAKETFKNNYNSQKQNFPVFFNNEFLNNYKIENPTQYFNDVNQQLLYDIYETRLKSFLKCEDRCGMWHSVESRTPFSDDIELLKLMFSFNGNKKIKNGISKYLLREALKDKLPIEIYSRYDKKGFETPMQDWIRSIRPQLISAVKAAEFDFVNYRGLEKSNSHNVQHNELLFKLFILSKWKNVFI